MFKSVFSLCLMFGFSISSLLADPTQKATNPDYNPNSAPALATRLDTQMTKLKELSAKKNITQICYQAAKLEDVANEIYNEIHKGETRVSGFVCLFKNCYDFSTTTGSVMNGVVDNDQKPGYSIYFSNFCESPSEYSIDSLVRGIEKLSNEVKIFTEADAFEK